MYAIQAQIEHAETIGGITWRSTRGVPTFYIHPKVQGVLNEEQAERIGRTVIDPFGIMAGDPAYTIHITAVAA